MKHIIAVFLFFAFSQAHAGLVVEPFVGYKLSGNIDSAANDLNSKGSIAGLNLGGRVGYSFLGVTVGGEYIMNLKKEVTNDISGQANFDYDSNGISIYAAYALPVLVRGYAGYTFSYSGTITAVGSTTDQELKKGSGFFFGAGYTGLPFVSINVEFRTYSFDEAEQSGTAAALNDTSESQITLGVSAPLSIPFL